MTNCEILAMLQPVLNEGLFHAIEAVFDREDRQAKALSALQDALKTTVTDDMYERRKAIRQEDRDYSECKRDLANHGILTLNKG